MRIRIRASPDPKPWLFLTIFTGIFIENLHYLCRQHRRCTAAAADTSTAAPLQDRPPQKRPGRKRREIWAAASSGGDPCPSGGPSLGKRPPTPSTHHSNNNDDKFAGGELRVTWLHADGALAACDGGPPGRALWGAPPHWGGQENSQGTYRTPPFSVIPTFMKCSGSEIRCLFDPGIRDG